MSNKLLHRLFPVDPNEVDTKNQPERVILILSFVFSLFGVVLSGITIRGSLDPKLSLLKDMIIFWTLLVLVLFFYMRYRQLLADKLRAELAVQSQLSSIRQLIVAQIGIYNSLMANTKNILYSKVGKEVYPNRFNYKVKDLKEHMEKHLSLVMDGLIDIVRNQLKVRDISVEEDLSVSVKALVTKDMVPNLVENKNDPRLKLLQDKEMYVITLDRDTHTKTLGKREVKRNFFNVNKNTAYLSLYSKSKSEIDDVLVNTQDFFLNNNLQALSNVGGYHNQSENWRNYYNSTLVVPIYRETYSPDESGIYGFLTIDCLNKKGLEIFSDKDTLPILLYGAELLALIFLSLDLYDLLQSERNHNVDLQD